MATAVEVRERPILMSGEMVRGILDGRKTQTRRVVQPQPAERFTEPQIGPGWICTWWRVDDDLNDWHDVRLPFQPGDLLYVRETWRITNAYDVLSPKESVHFVGEDCEGFIQYQADGIKPDHMGHWGKWRRSFHMPKAFSRIWLEVTAVRAERVQDITTEDVWSEGVQIPSTEDGKPLVRFARHDGSPGAAVFFTKGRLFPGQPPLTEDELARAKGRLFPGQPPLTEDELARAYFAELWESLNAKRGYSWNSNPWVWVVEFTRLSAGGE